LSTPSEPDLFPDHGFDGFIRGADRVDLFAGPGELGELVAGSMKQKGALYFLLKKD